MARKKSQYKTPVFQDKCVIYYSRTDKCWIAHSLHTDQIGTGECVVNALADLLRAVNQIITIAREDDTVRIFRKAPKAIQEKAKRAEMLPREIYEIAHKIVHDTWPEDIDPNFKSPHNHPFTTNIVEPMTV